MFKRYAPLLIFCAILQLAFLILVNFRPHDLSCPKFVPWCQINAFHPRSNSLLLLLKYEGGEIIETTTITLLCGKKKFIKWSFIHVDFLALCCVRLPIVFQLLCKLYVVRFATLAWHETIYYSAESSIINTFSVQKGKCHDAMLATSLSTIEVAAPLRKWKPVTFQKKNIEHPESVRWHT